MSHHECMKCQRKIDYDVDNYTLFCNACLTAACEQASVRAERIEAGDTSVENMTNEERKKVLEVRRNQRAALGDER